MQRRNGWFDSKRSTEAKQRVGDVDNARGEMLSTAILQEADKRRALSTKIVVLIFVMLHRFGNLDKRGEITRHGMTYFFVSARTSQLAPSEGCGCE